MWPHRDCGYGNSALWMLQWVIRNQAPDWHFYVGEGKAQRLSGCGSSKHTDGLRYSPPIPKGNPWPKPFEKARSQGTVEC